MTQAKNIPLDVIDLGDRLRPIDENWAQAMAASFIAKGQDTPILVRPQGEGRYLLVAGAHRRRAAEIAGFKTIRAEIREMSADEARLAEIDENLMRAELTALDRAIFLAERKRVWDALYPETAKAGQKAKKKQSDEELRTTCPQFLPQTFTKEAALRTGLSDRTIRRSIHLASILTPQAIRELRGSALADNAAALKALAREDAAHQAKIAQAISSGQSRNIRSARVALGLAAPVESDPAETRYAKFLDLCGRSTKRDLRRMAAHLEKLLKD